MFEQIILHLFSFANVCQGTVEIKYTMSMLSLYLFGLIQKACFSLRCKQQKHPGKVQFYNIKTS